MRCSDTPFREKKPVSRARGREKTIRGCTAQRPTTSYHTRPQPYPNTTTLQTYKTHPIHHPQNYRTRPQPHSNTTTLQTYKTHPIHHPQKLSHHTTTTPKHYNTTNTQKPIPYTIPHTQQKAPPPKPEEELYWSVCEPIKLAECVPIRVPTREPMRRGLRRLTP